MNISRQQIPKILGFTSIVGNLGLPVTDGVAILFHPGYNPLSQSVSDLALGPFGWIQGIGLFLGGIGAITLALILWLELGKQWEIRFGETLILIVGICLIIAATIHTDPPGHKTTLLGEMHGWASFAGGVFALPAFFLVSPGLRNNKRLFIYTIVAGVLQVILEVGRGRMPADWSLFGLHERLIVTNGVLWMVVVSWAIMKEHLRHRE